MTRVFRQRMDRRTVLKGWLALAAAGGLGTGRAGAAQQSGGTLTYA